MYRRVGANSYLFTCKWPKWICTYKDYRYFRRHFENHSKQLQCSILKEKHKRKEKQVTCCDLPTHKCIVPAFRAHKHSCKMDSHMKNCTVASQWTNCKCSKTPNSLNKNSPLSKTKGIKMTQKRYQEVVNGKKKVWHN